MNIVLIASEYGSQQALGGIGVFVNVLGTALAEMGNRVHIVTAQKPIEPPPSDNILLHHVPLQLFPLPNAHGLGAILHRMGRSLRIRKFVESLAKKERIDVVHVADYGYEGLALTLASPAPVLLTLHGPHFWVNRRGAYPSTLASRIDERLEKLAVFRANHITAPSQSMRDLALAEYDGVELLNKITVVPNPVNVDMFHPIAEPKSVFPKDMAQVTFVGRLQRRKGIDVLAKAIPYIVSRNATVAFAFIGRDMNTPDGKASMRETVCRQLQESVPDTPIMFLGQLPYETLPEYYAGSTIVTVPSLDETFGYVAVEAMAAGKAVVASNVGGLAEIIDHGLSGVLVQPGDAQELGNAIVRLLEDPAYRHSIGQCAREAVVRKYSAKAIARVYANLYSNLAR